MVWGQLFLMTALPTATAEDARVAMVTMVKRIMLVLYGVGKRLVVVVSDSK